MTPTAKKKHKKDRLSKKAKIEIIIEVMTENPGGQLRRGFNKAVAKHFLERHNVVIQPNYMSMLIKETKEQLERQQGYLYSRREYLLQHARLGKILRKAQDIVVEEGKVQGIVTLVKAAGDVLNDMERLEGHLKVEPPSGGNPEAARELGEFFDDEKKKETTKPGGNHGKQE